MLCNLVTKFNMSYLPFERWKETKESVDYFFADVKGYEEISSVIKDNMQNAGDVHFYLY